MMAKTKTEKPDTQQEVPQAQPLRDPEGPEAPGEQQPQAPTTASGQAPAATATAEAPPQAQQAHDAEFAHLDAQAQPESKASLDMILDLELQVTAELGRAEVMIRDLLQLGSGSIIELDKTVGEPVNVLVNSRLMAHGEVVVIDDSFGVRITEIVTPIERVQSVPGQEVEQS